MCLDRTTTTLTGRTSLVCEKSHKLGTGCVGAPRLGKDLLQACRAFVEQAEKMRGFPVAYEPYVGALVLARAAIRRCEHLKTCEARPIRREAPLKKLKRALSGVRLP
jgi:hypothetical protein